MNFDRYGIHWVEGDIALLIQQKSVDHVLGIPMTFPVTVKPDRSGLLCPHNMSLHEVAGVPEVLIGDPLVEAMSPRPKGIGEPAVHVEDLPQNRKLVQELLRLSSTNPSGSMRPLWMGTEKWNVGALSLTNVSPLVLYGFSNHHIWLARKILDASQYLPRRLIFMGPPETTVSGNMRRIKPTVTLEQVASLPLEQIGAGILKDHMLGKPNESSMG